MIKLGLHFCTMKSHWMSFSLVCSPGTHCLVQNVSSSLLSQVFGQAVPHSWNTFPSGHCCSGDSVGHSSSLTHFLSSSTVPAGQKQSERSKVGIPIIITLVHNYISTERYSALQALHGMYYRCVQAQIELHVYTCTQTRIYTIWRRSALFGCFVVVKVMTKLELHFCTMKSHWLSFSLVCSPGTHCRVQMLKRSSLLSQVLGQAVPHSWNTFPSGHCCSGDSVGHSSSLTHLLSSSTVPAGQKQSEMESKILKGRR